MSKLDQLKTVLQSKNLWAKKTLGQNFLVDDQALDQIIEAADLYEGDEVVEVGPGTGFLTERLIQAVKHVTTVELDPDMVDILKAQFSLTENLTLVHSDILKLSSKQYALSSKHFKVVANIPYYITSPVIRHFLSGEMRPKLMVLLVQKEVAEKICSLRGRSFITMETAIQGHAEYIATVPRTSFYPAPQVDSAIIKITVFPKPNLPPVEMQNLASLQDDFLRIIKFGYSQKRKKLTNSLGAGLHKEVGEMRELLISASIDPNVRAEDLEVEDWKRLYKALKDIGKR